MNSYKKYKPVNYGLFTSLVEVWKDINGYEGIYQVSSFGRVKSLDRMRNGPRGTVRQVQEKILKQKENDFGYLTVHLRTGKESHPLVHRLVALSFIPNTSNKLTVNHLDTNKKNNNVSNLEWATHSEQMSHALCNNLTDQSFSHIYSPEFKLSVRKYYEESKCSIKELSRLFKISERSAGRFIQFTERPVKIPDSEIPKILELRNQGLTLEKISKMYNCGISQIHRITKGLSRNVQYEK